MKLQEINAALENLGDSVQECIEIVRTGPKQEEEVTIFANREGLIRIASYCLDLAERQSEGSHYHFDQASVDAAEVPLVITFRRGAEQAAT
jgi:hypothetical protein